MTNPSPTSTIGESKLFSPQNGLLLHTDLHDWFDSSNIGIDPDVSYILENEWL